MRISTSVAFQTGVRGIQARTIDQVRLQQQLSSGRRILAPSDDPVASAKAMDIMQSDAMTGQFIENSTTADTNLRLTETSLNHMVSVLQDVRTLMVNSGNPVLSPADRRTLDSELKGRYQELLSLANTQDGNGLYLFSGFSGAVKPFSEQTFGQVAYLGDQGQRMVQISPSRLLPVSVAGDEMLFAKSVNGSFNLTPNSNNTLPLIASAGNISDPAQWNNVVNPQRMRVEVFSVPDPLGPVANPPLTRYDLIVDDPTSANFNKSLIDSYDYSLGPRTPSAANPNPYPRAYVSGQDVLLSKLGGEATPLIPNWNFGAKFQLTGTQAAGSVVAAAGVKDSFSIVPSARQDVFTSMASFSTALSSYGNGQQSTAAFQDQVNQGLVNIDNVMGQVLEVQTAFGSRMKEMDAVVNSNEDLGLQYKASLSRLTDLDYTKAISEFSLVQTYLEAARKSFNQVQQLSLFQYIG